MKTMQSAPARSAPAQSALASARRPRLDRDRVIDLIGATTANLLASRSRGGDGLYTAASGIVTDDKSWDEWNWPQGVGLYGLCRAYEVTGDARNLAEVRAWFDRAFARGVPVRNVNTTCPLLAMAFLYERTGDPRLREQLERWAHWAHALMPRTPMGGMQHVTMGAAHEGQLWTDTLMMTVLPLARIGRMLGRREYVDEAAYQFQVHAKYLMDGSCGLWFHGWTFEGHHHFAGAHWARGNAWVTVAIPEFLAIMGEGRADGDDRRADIDPALRRWLIALLEAQVEALAARQDPSGLWHTLVDHADSYLESSGSAGIAYGILRAVHLGCLDARWRGVALRAVAGLADRVDGHGAVHGVSLGTGVGETLDHYRRIGLSTMPYGQALTMLALVEALAEME